MQVPSFPNPPFLTPPLSWGFSWTDEQIRLVKVELAQVRSRSRPEYRPPPEQPEDSLDRDLELYHSYLQVLAGEIHGWVAVI
jgi:hypothetical protein